ncbi:MAG: class IV adenylate cyclase [Ignavibacteria bacterium]|jgi:predicted adenylyl cyclase CyaB
MRKNFELKVKLSNYDVAKWNAEKYIHRFKDKHHFLERQKDIYYYKVGGKRLKLRIINNEYGRLIYYDRKDNMNKRVSKYFLSDTKNPFELDKILRKLFKVQLIVNKTREIFTVNNLRIHLDRIQGVGIFLEFEIIYKSLDEAKILMKKLMKQFNIKRTDFIKDSYSDLILKKKKQKNAINNKTG